MMNILHVVCLEVDFFKVLFTEYLLCWLQFKVLYLHEQPLNYYLCFSSCSSIRSHTAARNFLLKHSSDYVVSLFLSLVTLKVLAPGSLSDFISHYVFPCSPSLTMLASKTPSMFLLQDVCIQYFLSQEHSFPRYLQGLLLHFIHVCTQMSPSQRILPQKLSIQHSLSLFVLKPTLLYLPF